MKFKAFIFDLDGTLTDSLEDLANSVNYALKTQGFPEHSKEEIRLRIGHGIDKLVESSLPLEKQHNTKILTQTLELMAGKYAESWKKNTCLFKDIEELLNQLMIKKIPIAILSNKPEIFLKEIADLLLSKWDFTMIIGSRGKYPLKPNPHSTLEIIKNFGLSEKEVALVGDGDTDIKTALAAGIHPIAVTWGFRTVDELKAVGAVTFIDTPLELLNFT